MTKECRCQRHHAGQNRLKNGSNDTSVRRYAAWEEAAAEEWRGEESEHELLTMRMGHVENKKGVIYFTSKNSDFVRSIPKLAPRKFDETCPKNAKLRKLRSQ
jgi:hypothetical protein